MQGPQWNHLEDSGSEDLSHTATPPGSTYTADTNTVVDSAEFAVAMAKLSDDLKGANSLTHLRSHQPAQWGSQASARAKSLAPPPAAGVCRAPCSRCRYATSCLRLPLTLCLRFHVPAHQAAPVCPSARRSAGNQRAASACPGRRAACVSAAEDLRADTKAPVCCCGLAPSVSELAHIAAPVCSPNAAPLSLHPCAVTCCLLGC